MRYRRLGDSGLVVSVVGIGCNNFGRKLDADGTRAVVDAALDAGINLFDTADIYGDPHGALRGAASARRSRAAATRSCWRPSSAWTWTGCNGADRGARGSRRYVVRAVEASLRRLGTDHIDLYQMHEPDPAHPDRGDPRRARRPGPRRQGALPRQLELRRLADRRRRLAARDPRLGAVRQRAEPLQPARPRGRGRGGAGLPALRAGPAAVLPAGQRPAHRQVPARRSRRRRAPGWPRTAYAGRLARAPWDTIEALRDVRGRARRLDARRRDRRAGRPAGGRVGDRRRHHAGPGAGQRAPPAPGSRRRRISPRWTRSA